MRARRVPQGLSARRSQIVARASASNRRAASSRRSIAPARFDALRHVRRPAPRPPIRYARLLRNARVPRSLLRRAPRRITGARQTRAQQGRAIRPNCAGASLTALQTLIASRVRGRRNVQDWLRRVASACPACSSYRARSSAEQNAAYSRRWSPGLQVRKRTGLSSGKGIAKMSGLLAN